MNDRNEHEPRWDDWLTLVGKERTQLEKMLAEAQRRFETAPDEPFSSRALRRLVASARDQMAESRGRVRGVRDPEWSFATEVSAVVGTECSVGVTDQWCGLVSDPLRTGWNHLMTDVDSTSVDMRCTYRNSLSSDGRLASVTESIVLDVGVGLSDSTSSQSRVIRAGTARSDTLSNAANSEMLGYSVAYTVNYDYADLSDEAMEELLRN